MDFPLNQNRQRLDLDDYHVPLLLYYPGDTRPCGKTYSYCCQSSRCLPTSLGLLGIRTANQAWGRDLFRLDSSDPGWAVLKPAGNSKKVAFVQGNSLLVIKSDFKPDLWKYKLNPWQANTVRGQSTVVTDLSQTLCAYLKTGLTALQTNRAGVDSAELLKFKMERN